MPRLGEHARNGRGLAHVEESEHPGLGRVGVELREVTSEVRHAVHHHDVDARPGEVAVEPARKGDECPPVALALDEHHGRLRAHASTIPATQPT